MAKNKITEYSETANDNTDVNSVNIDEGCPTGNLNNGERQIMAHLAKVNAGTDPLHDTLTLADPADETKQFRFDGVGVTPGQKRIISIPDKDITLGGPTTKAFVELTSGTTYTPDAAVVYFDVIAVGAGGGGGGADGQGSGTCAMGIGGGGGATAITYGVAPSGSYTYAIGAAGSGGAAAGGNGGDGGDTTISGTGLSLMTGTGGPGGNGRTGTSGGVRQLPILQREATGGNVNVPSMLGGDAFVDSGEYRSFPHGGSSAHGTGGRAQANANASDGFGYGAGGAGAISEDTTTNRTGGDGTAGVIFIIEYRNE